MNARILIACLLILPFETAVLGATQPTAQTLPPPENTTPSTWCRFVPERVDDFAWENDTTAYRAYGPAILKAKGSEGSGIDCWLKRVKYPIVDRWYAGNLKGISYHVDHGEGCDPYHTGASRGCGGLGIWKDDKMVVAGPYKEWKILSREPQKSVFELTYDYDVAGVPVHEVKRITIELGKRLFHVEATFTENGKPAALEIAVGVTTHDGKATATLNPQQGWMACWEVIGSSGGVGTGVAVAPGKIKWMKEIKSTVKDESHALLLLATDASGTVAYDAGLGWERGGEIKTRQDWENYLAGWKPE